jgi:inosine-uridine nucleoside N-ribohydrolase
MGSLVQRLERPPRPARIVLDTDTYNEIDDQFALAYAVLSPEAVSLEAVYAAPFHNERSSGPADGMEKSYAEIERVLERLGRLDVPRFRGATGYLPDADTPVPSAAVDDLIARARASHTPLYVVAIGAITNVASALLLAPDIADKIVIVWLGGHGRHHWHTWEFNLQQDLPAARIVLDGRAPLVLVPCAGVAEHLRTTEAEVREFVKGRGPIGDYLYQTYRDCYPDHFGRSRVLWDVVTIAWFVDPAFTTSALLPSPILTDQRTWSFDPRRPLIRELIGLDRDRIFSDFFRKIGKIS